MEEMADGAAPGHPEIWRVMAENPGPMTLTGTNTYLYGSDPCWVIDPGPADEAHISAVKAAIFRLRRRYAEMLRAAVAETVGSPADVDDEIFF